MTPAYACGRLLVGHQSQIGRGNGVAKGSQGRSQGEIASDSLSGCVAELVPFNHHVLAVLDQPAVNMKAVAGVAGQDLGGKADCHPVFVPHRPQHPHGKGGVVGGIFQRHRKQLNLVLFHHPVSVRDDAYLGVAVLHLSSRLNDSLHGFSPQPLPLEEWVGLLVTPLGRHRVEALAVIANIVFQLRHGLESEPGAVPQRLLGLSEGILGRAGQRSPVFRVVGAEYVHCGNGQEGIHEGGPVSGDDIQVA